MKRETEVQERKEKVTVNSEKGPSDLHTGHIAVNAWRAHAKS